MSLPLFVTILSIIQDLTPTFTFGKVLGRDSKSNPIAMKDMSHSSTYSTAKTL